MSMVPKPFKLDRDEFYIACHRPFKLLNGTYSGMIRVYELKQRPENENILTKMDWSLEPEIINPVSTTGYNSLEIQGQLVEYNKLVQDLCRSRLRVNRRGFCYFQLREGVVEATESSAITFYRMNDLWNWQDYGVTFDFLLEKPFISWDRLYILTGGKPTLILDSDDIEVKAQLESTKTRLSEKTKEVNNLNTRIAHQDDENRTLKNEVIMLNSEICKKNSENQSFAEQVKKLQAELETVRRHQSPPSDSNKPPVPCDVFILKSIPFRWENYNTYTMYWTASQDVPRTLTPTHQPVHRTFTFPIPVTFNLIPGESFDVSNWFYMRVRERSAPILIYEGNACSLTVGGHTMTSPIESSTIINWGEYVDLEQQHFDFVPVALVGYGTRIAILQWHWG